ncbi:MAG: 5-(carboxyamino)imidazole ribonucleotide mutase [Alphaproteobacteria bacterium TMED62]|nr:MAG: 5-(carboxyamino)imidazole ribonucleotide mutase [Alphaproteobacteria bacterium TMED62]
MEFNMKIDKVSIIMGSKSDWKTLQLAENILDEFKIPNEVKIISAHRTPDRLYRYAKNLNKNNIKVIIAGAGGAAHLPGMVASLTTIPVLGVPIESKFMNGLDSLLSIVQMPYGIPTATFAVGESGAKNAAIFAISLLAISEKKILVKLNKWRQDLTKAVNISPK